VRRATGAGWSRAVGTPADLRRLALALPETYEDIHRRRPAFRVDKRIFAMLGVTGNESLFTSLGWDDVAVVKLDREDQLNLAAGFPDAIQPTETYGHHGWTYIRLEAIDAAALAIVIRLAWTHVAPKRLSKGSIS
jgi:hypothetical protein